MGLLFFILSCSHHRAYGYNKNKNKKTVILRKHYVYNILGQNRRTARLKQFHNAGGWNLAGRRGTEFVQKGGEKACTAFVDEKKCEKPRFFFKKNSWTARFEPSRNRGSWNLPWRCGTEFQVQKGRWEHSIICFRFFGFFSHETDCQTRHALPSHELASQFST